MTTRAMSHFDTREGALMEAMRYGVVSLVALGVDLAVLSVAYRVFSLHPWISATAGFTAGVIAAYLLSTQWAFRNRRFAHLPSEFVIFMGIGVLALLLNNLVLLGLHYQFDWPPEAAKMPSAVLTFLFNFGVRRHFLFAAPPASRVHPS